MDYELIAKPNTWDRTFTIRLKYTKGIEKYRTNKLTEDEFKVMSTYTPKEWEIYLDTADNYKKLWNKKNGSQADKIKAETNYLHTAQWF